VIVILQGKDAIKQHKQSKASEDKQTNEKDNHHLILRCRTLRLSGSPTQLNKEARSWASPLQALVLRGVDI